MLITFPGQGSQATGMGLEFYENFPVARQVFEEVDDALNQKLSTLMFSGSIDDLTLTQNAQPALMAVSMAITRVLEHELGAPLSDKATFFAGHSLGEYSAYCAVKSLSISDTARLLRIRGIAMQKAVPFGEGAMAAILGLDLTTLEDVIASYEGGLVCVIANDNSPGQLVISGHAEAVTEVSRLALEAGAKRAVPLAVSAPFHSPLMYPASERMAEALDQTLMTFSSKPVISNVTLGFIQAPDVAKKALVEQVTGRVRWRETIASVKPLGVTRVVEIGAGKVLSGLVKRIDPDLESITVNKPADMDFFLKM